MENPRCNFTWGYHSKRLLHIKRVKTYKTRVLEPEACVARYPPLQSTVSLATPLLERTGDIQFTAPLGVFEGNRDMWFVSL